MKAQTKRLVTLTLALLMLFSVITVCGVSAAENNTVKVIVQNTRLATEDSAPWYGTLIDTEITLSDSDSMESVIERAIKDEGYEFTINNYGYISSINGLSEYAANGNGGWMATLNNWFTADATTAYTVANGGLQPGDEIIMMYSCAWGADVGSLYGDFTTTLDFEAFGISGSHVLDATYREMFVPDVTDYTIMISATEDELSFNAVPYNKNYQARVYKNDYQPTVADAEYRGGKNVPVKDGDTVFIGVGNPAWPTMNSWAGTADETVYTFRIKYVPVGDLNHNGGLDIGDVTVLQRHLAEYTNEDGTAMIDETDANLFNIADYDGNGKINVYDVTEMQRALAGFEE